LQPQQRLLALLPRNHVYSDQAETISAEVRSLSPEDRGHQVFGNSGVLPTIREWDFALEVDSCQSIQNEHELLISKDQHTCVPPVHLPTLTSVIFDYKYIGSIFVYQR